MSALLPDVDWRLAAELGGRRPQPGPTASRVEVAAAVDELKDAADRAIDLVSAASGLPVSAKPPVLVVDRPTWMQAAAEVASELMGALGSGPPRHLGQKVSRRALATVVAPALRFLSGRILGQYDPFCRRFLLVAPNIVRTERVLGVPPSDFRLWVCLHEQTHAVQFATAPWLSDHLLGLVRVVAQSSDGPPVPGRSRSMPFFIDLITSPDGRDALDRVSAVMGLLEGHADVMMDRAATGVIGDVERIRTAFDAQRGAKQSVVAQQLGVSAKLEQYSAGARFCREVLRLADRETLNLAFRDESSLPTLIELTEPGRWLTRVRRG